MCVCGAAESTISLRYMSHIVSAFYYIVNDTKFFPLSIFFSAKSRFHIDDLFNLILDQYGMAHDETVDSKETHQKNKCSVQ